MEKRELIEHRTNIWYEKRRFDYLKLIPKRIGLELKNGKEKSGVKFENSYIWGPVGSGKSYMASTILMEAAFERYLTHHISTQDYQFVSIPTLLYELKNSFGNGNNEDILNKYIKVPFLILDDVASEKMSDWVRETLDYLIDQRYSNNRKTIYTSNLPLEKLNERLDDEGRIVSRIKGSCEIYKLTGKDRRRK